MATTARVNETHETLLIDPQNPEDTKRKKISLFKGQIILNPSISKINFFCFLLYNVYLGLILLPADLFQASVLSTVYKLDDDAQSDLTSEVQFSGLAVQLFTASLVGYLCDKYGRKIIIFFGLILLCATIFMTPNFPTPYPYYIINQSVQSLSSTALSIPPLLADYVDGHTQGKVAGITSVLIYAGSLLMTILNTVQKDTVANIHRKFLFMGILASGLGLWIILGIKGGNSYFKDTPHASSSIPPSSDEMKNSSSVRPESESELQSHLRPHVEAQSPSVLDSEPGLMAGIKEGRNPWIFTGYVVNFLATSSLGLTGFILVKYVVYLTQDETKANLAYALVSKYLLSALICSMFFGTIADKVNKMKLTMIIILCSITSITLLTLIKDPEEPLAYISMILFGMASSGYLIFSQQLLSQYSSPRCRGSVIAFGGILSLGGTVTINILGVYLLRWNIYIPFYICLGSSVIGLFILIILYLAKRKFFNQKEF